MFSSHCSVLKVKSTSICKAMTILVSNGECNDKCFKTLCQKPTDSICRYLYGTSSYMDPVIRNPYGMSSIKYTPMGLLLFSFFQTCINRLSSACCVLQRYHDIQRTSEIDASFGEPKIATIRLEYTYLIMKDRGSLDLDIMITWKLIRNKRSSNDWSFMLYGTKGVFYRRIFDKVEWFYFTPK